jgi:hypothetical protein
LSTPYEGAHRIWQESFHECYDFLNAGSDLVDLLGAFVGYADEWEDHEDRPDMSEELRASEGLIRDSIDGQIRACAAEYLQLFAQAELPPERR